MGLPASIRLCLGFTFAGMLPSCVQSTGGNLSGLATGGQGATASGTGATTQGFGPLSGSTATTIPPAAETSSTGADAPKFDLGLAPDALKPEAPIIPETCDQASAGETSVGCEFFTVDLDNNIDLIQFAVVVSNVQLDQSSEVVIEQRVAGVWQVVAGPESVAPLSLLEFPLDDFHTERSGLAEGGAYRISSDVPIIAYQFNPIDGATSFLSDASMLYPVASWDSINSVVGWGPFSLLTVAAATDGTVIEITTTAEISPGPGVPLIPAQTPTLFTLNAGDAISFSPTDRTQPFTGTWVTTDPETPVAIFSGNQCANIPADTCCCDHLEEQLSGVQLWGQDFVAPHMPVRNPADPESTLWQIYASEDDTQIVFAADPLVTGIDAPNITLQRGEVHEMYVTAPAGTEADFGVSADKPISVLGYMIGARNLPAALMTIGDPSMIQFPAVEQFLPRYVVLVPGTWINDRLILTRSAGAAITLDAIPVPDAAFTPAGDGTWEVARVDVADGVHIIDGGTEPFGVVVIGWDEHDSYAYVGGTGTGKINLNPAG